MAITGTLKADFTDFVTAVAAADVRLKSFAAGAGDVQTALQKVADSFSGKKIIQDATLMAQVFKDGGGAAGFTTTELQRMGKVGGEAIEKLHALGKDVPADLQAMADGAKKVSDGFGEFAGKFDIQRAISDPLAVAKEGLGAFVSTLGPTGIALAAAGGIASGMGGELIHLGNEAEAIGAQIGRMGVQFNIPVEALSDLRFAVKAGGGDFDTFGDSMFTFQKRIEENGAAVAKGMQKIGLSFDTVKALRPDEQFLAISDAVRGAGAEVNKSAVAFEIFGKQGKEILPLLLKPLSDLVDESQRLGDTWSGESVAAARAFRGELVKMAAETEEAWTVLGRDVAPVTNELTLAWARMKLAVADVALTTIELFPAAADTIRHAAGSTGELDLAMQTLGATQAAAARLFVLAAAEGLNYGDQVNHVAKQLLEMGFNQKTVAEQTGLSAGAVRTLAGEVKNAATENEKYSQAWASITSSWKDGIPSIAGVSAETKGLVAMMRAAGNSAETMATGLGLTVLQIHLLKKEEEEAAAATKKVGDAFKASVEEINSSGDTWMATVAGRDGAVASYGETLLRAGVSQAAVAANLGLTATETKALTSDIKAQDEALKLHENAIDRVNQLWAEYNTAVVTDTGTALDRQIAAIDDWGARQERAIEKLIAENKIGAADVEATYDALTAAWTVKLARAATDAEDVVLAAFRSMKGESASAADEIRGHWTNAFNELTDGCITWRSAMSEASAAIDGDLQRNIKNVQTLSGEFITAAEAKKRFDNGGSADVTSQNFKAVFDDLNTTGGLNPKGAGLNLAGAENLASLGYSFAEIIRILTSGGSGTIPPPQGPRIPGFADGIQNFSGGLALVGERGPELVNLPAGSDVLPLGSGGSVTVHNTIFVNGTAADVARQVAAEIMKTAKQGRKFGST